MTQTVERRPLIRPAGPTSRSAGGILAPALTAAAWAVGAGLVAFAVPVLLVWATDSRSGSGAAAAARTAGQLWLLAQGTSLSVPGGVVGLTPLGLAALPLALLHRAGRHSARAAAVSGLRKGLQLLLSLAFAYAVAVAALTAVLATRSVRPDPVRGLLGALLVAAAGAGSGVLREAGLLGGVRRLPARALRLAVGTGVAIGVLLVGGGALVGLALAAHAGRATSLAGASGPGLVGGSALLLLGILLVPNAAVWGASWLVGPGFAVGVGTSVGPWGTSLGAVPAFPLLATLPGGQVPTWAAILGLLVPVVGGVLGGLVVARRLGKTSALTAAREAAYLGPCAGLAAAMLAAVSGGPLGGRRLTAVGPSPWRVGLAVAVEIAVPAALAAAVAVRRRA